MRVCHLTTVHKRFDVRIFWKECISISKAGHEVILIVNDELENEKKNGVNIVSINRPYRNRISRILSRKTRKKALEIALSYKADIYHFHDPELLYLGNKLKKLGYYVIYDTHEDVPRQILVKYWIPQLVRKLISLVFERFENYYSAKFDAIIVPTLHIKNRFLLLNDSVFEICNYPSLDDICFSGQIYSNKNPSCYIGDLSVTRGIGQIAQATHKAGIKLILCGEPQPKSYLDEILYKYKNVSYLGVLGRNEVSNLLSNSSMGFVTLLNTPNDSFSYPIKLFEYMAAGLPVISSNFPIYTEIVEGNSCGICVDPQDINAICEAIKLLISNRDKCNEFRLNGYKAIKSKYNWENEAQKLLSCYESIFNEKLI